MKYLKQLIITGFLLFNLSAYAQTTTIWLARHAEKEATPAADPDLTADGKVRANELAKQLQKQKIVAVFSTPYKRTSQTGEPTLKQFKLAALSNYNPSALPAFAKQLLADYPGKTVLIVGHSNTLIPTLQAFGAEKPFDTLSDEDYDILFKITISADGKASVTAKHYGAKHHTTVLPESLLNAE